MGVVWIKDYEICAPIFASLQFIFSTPSLSPQTLEPDLNPIELADDFSSPLISKPRGSSGTSSDFIGM